jgi:hypothetical protein
MRGLDTAAFGHEGRGARVGGPLFCPVGATADIEVTVTQAGSSAIATGRTHARCTAGETSFTVDVKAGSTPLQAAGTALACGAAWIHDGAQGFDAFQWCREITLLPEGGQLEN